jgi:hypothetical protein
MENEGREGENKQLEKKLLARLEMGGLRGEDPGVYLGEVVETCRKRNISFLDLINRNKDYVDKNNLFLIDNDLEMAEKTNVWLGNLDTLTREKLVNDSLGLVKQIMSGELDLDRSSAKAVKLAVMALRNNNDEDVIQKIREAVQNKRSNAPDLEMFGRLVLIAAGSEKETNEVISALQGSDESGYDGMYMLIFSPKSEAWQVLQGEMEKKFEKGEGFPTLLGLLDTASEIHPAETAVMAEKLMDKRLAVLGEIKDRNGGWNVDAMNEVMELYMREDVCGMGVYKLALRSKDPAVRTKVIGLLEGDTVPDMETYEIIAALGKNMKFEDVGSLMKYAADTNINGYYSAYGEALFLSLGKVMRKEGVRYGDDKWQEVVSCIPDSVDKEKWVASLTFEMYLVDRQPGEARRLLVENIASVDMGLLSKRSSAALELAQEKVLSGKPEDEAAGLEIFANIKSSKEENRRWRNVMAAIAKAHPQDMAVLRKVNEAMVTRAENCSDPEIINYLIDEFSNLVRKGTEDEKMMVFAETLVNSKARYATRRLYETIIDEATHKDVAKTLIVGLAKNELLDTRILGGDMEQVTGAVQEILRSNLRVTKEVVDMVLSGKSIQEIKAEYKKTLDSPIRQRVLDQAAMSLEYSCAEQTEQFDNVFGYKEFRLITDGIRTVDTSDNEAVAKRIQSFWERESGGDIEEVERQKAVFDYGLRDMTLTIGEERSDAIRREERLSEQLSFFAAETKAVVLTDQLLGRIEGLAKKMAKNNHPTDGINGAMEVVSKTVNTNGQQMTNFEEVYSELFALYSDLHNRAVEVGLLADGPSTQDEIRWNDENKYESDLDKVNSVEGISLLTDKVQAARKRVDKLKIEDGGWAQAVGDLSGALNKLRESAQKREESAGVGDGQHEYILRFLSPSKDLYSFCRAGDARESCIATNGVNKWTIPGYIMNEGTRAFMVIDAATNKAVGHSITHTYESSDKVGVISNGIYLDNDVPLGVADGLAGYMEEWAQASGFDGLKIALSGYSDVVPEGWDKEMAELRVLQGVKVDGRDLYYDGQLQAASIVPTEVLGRVVPDARN